MCQTAPMTSENPTVEKTAESRGYIETLVGGLVGGTIGVLVGLPIANAASLGGLEAIATALLILFLALCLGAAIGAAIALKVRKRQRPVVTALVAVPAMFIASYLGVLVATRLTDTDVFLLPLVILASILALIAARAMATMRDHSSEPVRED